LEPEELANEARRLADEAGRLGKALERAGKALEALGDSEAWKDPGIRRKAWKAIEACGGEGAEKLLAFAEEARASVRDLEPGWRRALLDELHEAFLETGIELRKSGERPPVFEAGILSLTLEFEKGVAEIAYGREKVARVPLRPRSLPGAVGEANAFLARGWPGAETLFRALRASWGAALGRRGGDPSGRVELGDLPAELELSLRLLGAWPKGWESGALDRARFAYWLDRLAMEGRLAFEGWRLELGTATGGSARDRKRVLFLRAGMGGGQYYLSLRFVREGEV